MPKSTTKAAEAATPTVAIEVPLIRRKSGYVARHVEVQLRREHAETLRAIGHGLVESGATLKSGKSITYDRSFIGDTIRWLLEQAETVRE